MLPEGLLPRPDDGPALSPRYLRDDDLPWLRALLDVFRAHVGRPRRELMDRLREPLSVEGPPDKRKRAVHVLERLTKRRVKAAVKPGEARAALFGARARGLTRGEAIRVAAEALEVEPTALLESLFADLPGERRLLALPADLGPDQLALRTNLAMVQGLVARSQRVTVRAHGGARDLVRHARLMGLLCEARPLKAGAILDLSGPYALFRRTLVYGRALASLVPRLPWCDDFELRADYRLDDEARTLVVQPGDPLFPCAEPRRFDSKLEARFARDFARHAPDWDLVREPLPLEAEGALIFPDFELVHRPSGERVLLEIVGFWTEGYLETKLRRLRAASIDRLVLCVDAERACGRSDWPAGARVVPYRRRVDVGEVLAAITPRPPGTRPCRPREDR